MGVRTSIWYSVLSTQYSVPWSSLLSKNAFHLFQLSHLSIWSKSIASSTCVKKKEREKGEGKRRGGMEGGKVRGEQKEGETQWLFLIFKRIFLKPGIF